MKQLILTIGHNMFDLFAVFDDLLQDIRVKKQIETIIVAKPYCSPARPIVEEIFKTYGVKLLGYRDRLEYIGSIPSIHKARITVSSKQAVWAEYLLLRSNKFMLMSKPKNKRNLEWAKKHSAMPESWNGKPLIERNCKEGLEALKKAGKDKSVRK